MVVKSDGKSVGASAIRGQVIRNALNGKVASEFKSEGEKKMRFQLEDCGLRKQVDKMIEIIENKKYNPPIH